MDKKTLLAIVIAVVVITVGFFIQSRVTKTQEEKAGVTETAPRPETSAQDPAEQEAAVPLQISTESDEVEPVEMEEAPEEQRVTVETDLYTIVFSTEGGTIESLKLKEHKEKDGSPVDLIFKGESDLNAFELHFGGPEVKPVDAAFTYNQKGRDTFVFTRDFRAPSEEYGEEGDIFTLTKRYVFKPGEYLFTLEINIDNSKNEYPNLEKNGYAYSLSVGPQIGPEFEQLDRRTVVRNYIYYADGKQQNVRLGRDGTGYVDQRAMWYGLTGKYFSIIAVPDATDYKVSFFQLALTGLPVGSQMYISRSPIKSADNTDTFRIYAGPNLKNEMSRYNDPNKNTFGTRDLDLEKAMRSSRILGWLETLLRWILQGCYRLIPNYGVAIILLTVVIKIVLFPLTRKSFDSTIKMQALSPKIQEIREKYKDNPQKMNQETQALYKKEGVSPLGGCLPLLLQMPIFIALYGLLNNHFALRGAVFIPGWISDLSQPEYIWHHGASIPVIGEYLRLLPIIFVGTQLISSRIMQSPSTGSQGNMKMMTYAMPIVFFFILYDAPSGLILYWTMTNLLTVLQQWGIKKIRERRENK